MRTSRLLRYLILALSLGVGTSHATKVLAQPSARTAGPVIEEFGGVFDVPNPDLAIPDGYVFRAVFEVRQAGDEAGQLNPRIDTLARFLNMHAAAGVPAERMKLVLVVHGTAGKDLLNDEAYRARFSVDNPNRKLLSALAKTGVEIYLCGQTAAARDLPLDQLLPEVKVALSAMTALVLFQDQGYRLIAF